MGIAELEVIDMQGPEIAVANRDGLDSDGALGIDVA